MSYSKNLSKFAKLAKYLRNESKEICRINDCKSENHNCESYAYLDEKGDLCTISMPDYCQRSYPSLISLPFYGFARDAKREFEKNLME